MFKESRHREQIIKETAHKKELEKARIKELEAANKRYNKKIKKQKRKVAAAAKVICNRERAEQRAVINVCKA